MYSDCNHPYVCLCKMPNISFITSKILLKATNDSSILKNIIILFDNNLILYV